VRSAAFERQDRLGLPAEYENACRSLTGSAVAPVSYLGYFDVKYHYVKILFWGAAMERRDSIETFINQWKRERPDLDPWPVGVLGRTQRISAHLQTRATNWLAPLGLTWESFSLLLALRRSGAPYELRPTEIYKESLLSSGAVTNRIDNVEKKGWVKRFDSPDDRRGIVVRLTASGRALADKAVEIHFRELASHLSKMSKKERQMLLELLGKVLESLEESD
jgi:DNA-binding MarR family transcriptional regulator